MQYDRHKAAKKKLHEIDKNRKDYLIIHYSCESFYNITDGHTPRVTSIAIFSFASEQTDSFSIHKSAEKLGICFNEIDSNYDMLEKSMLDGFFQFVKEHKYNSQWIHWNMRDINYGFKAIEHRYEVLKGNPIQIENNKKIDLAKLLKQFYGDNYIEHPRLEKLIAHNNISNKDYLNGSDEATAFSEKEYIKLHRSTLRKVEVFSSIIDKMIENKLLVNSSWKDMYGISFQAIFEVLSSKWWWGLLTFFLGIITSIIF